MLKVVVVLAAGILCMALGVGLYAWNGHGAVDAITWDVTLIGKGGEERILSYDEIKSMPSIEGRGGFFTTVGVVNGPYEVKGVPIEEICDLVGGLSPSDIVFCTAKDGYSTVFDYEEVGGNVDTFDPATMKLVPHGELKLILAYEQDGKRLSEENGKPLRLAIVGQEDLLTEGHHWVKWINKIEVVRLDSKE